MLRLPVIDGFEEWAQPSPPPSAAAGSPRRARTSAAVASPRSNRPHGDGQGGRDRGGAEAEWRPMTTAGFRPRRRRLATAVGKDRGGTLTASAYATAAMASSGAASPRLGSARGPGPRVDGSMFRSAALDLQLRLHEVLGEAALEAYRAPPAAQTAGAFELLARVADVARDDVADVLHAVQDILFESVYAPYEDTTIVDDGAGADGDARPTTAFPSAAELAAASASDARKGRLAAGLHRERPRVPYHAAVSRLEGRIAELEADVERLEKRKDVFDEQVRERDAQLDAVREELRAANEVNASWNTVLAESRGETERVRGELAKKVKYLDIVEANLERVEMEVDELKQLQVSEALAKARAEADDAKDKVRELDGLLMEALSTQREQRTRIATMVEGAEHERVLEELRVTSEQRHSLNASLQLLRGEHYLARESLGRFEDMKGRMTPRPEWMFLASVYAEEDFEGNSTEETARMLCDEVVFLRAENFSQRNELLHLRHEMALTRRFMGETDEDLNHRDDHKAGDEVGRSARKIPCLGTGREVPPYLRFEGSVAHRHMTKFETEKMIKDIWRAKKLHDENRREPDSLSSYLFTYLQRKYGRQASVAMYGYNLMDSLDRYDYDCDVYMFKKILDGDLPLAVYDEQENIESFVTGRARTIDWHENLAPTGSISKKRFLDALGKMYPAKSDAQLLDLKRAIHRDQPGEKVNYEKLFEETPDFDQGDFAEALRRQNLQDVESYLGEIRRAIHAVRRSGKNTARAMSKILRDLDPDKPSDELEEMIAFGLKLKSKTDLDLRKKNPIIHDLDAFAARLVSFPWPRSTKKIERAVGDKGEMLQLLQNRTSSMLNVRDFSLSRTNSTSLKQFIGADQLRMGQPLDDIAVALEAERRKQREADDAEVARVLAEAAQEAAADPTPHPPPVRPPIQIDTE